MYDHGLLDVGQGNLVYWEARGNPRGRPVLVVHGGPGSGRPRGAHERFDPAAFQVVLFDQRCVLRENPARSPLRSDTVTAFRKVLLMAVLLSAASHAGLVCRCRGVPRNAGLGPAVDDRPSAWLTPLLSTGNGWLTCSMPADGLSSRQPALGNT